MRQISVLGSTGSIGTQTLQVVRNNKDIHVAALAAGSNVDLIEQQIREFRPELAVLWEEKKAEELKLRVADLDVKVSWGMEGLMEAASIPAAETVVTAVVGMMTLVTAGHLIIPLAKEKGVKILPVDSEHSAIFQCLQGERGNHIDKILLTASGGPFRGWTLEQMKKVQLEDALKHPNWSMGHKITIDSSTMVNKGLEVMEAKWLFGVDIDRIQVLVQPQSVIHSAVQFDDGAVIAQLGTPDMKLPIQYALYYPERRYLPGDRLDFGKLARITFEDPDPVNFPGLALALRAGRTGGSMPTVFNAANERAVAMFLKKQIGYLDIARIIEEAMDAHKVIAHPDLDQILRTEQETYDFIAAR